MSTARRKEFKSLKDFYSVSFPDRDLLITGNQQGIFEFILKQEIINCLLNSVSSDVNTADIKMYCKILPD